MKIIYILRATYGAAGEAASFQYASIMTKKSNVLVLTSKNTGQPDVIVSNDANVKAINIYAPSMLKQVMNVYREIQKFKPDIIHVIQSPYCFHYVFYLKAITPLSKWIVDFRSPHIGDKKSPAIKRYFFLQFYADKILTHSMLSLNTNIPLRLVSAEEIPPGIDISLFVDTSSEFLNITKPKRFVFIGSINKTRKIEFLVSTFGRFAKKNELDIHLDIYGNGNSFDEIQKIIKEKKLAKYITLKGAVVQKKLLMHISGYDVGIAYVPYEFFNTAPSLKSLEYAAAKIAVIASDTMGHMESNQKNGFDFKLFKNTKDGFSKVLMDVINNGVSKENIIKNHKAALRYDWHWIVMKKLLMVYQNLLN